MLGAGQWLEEKHGAKSRLSWRKLRLAVDAHTGMIVSHTLREQHAGDPSQVSLLLDQIDGEIAREIADGAHASLTMTQLVNCRSCVPPANPQACVSGRASPQRCANSTHRL